MALQQFNFGSPAWLWGIFIIPAIWALYYFFYHPNAAIRNLENFIDKELLPHLLKGNNASTKNVWKPLALWSALWLCAIIAMAGPRWDYTDIDTFNPDQSLVILLDLSQSMESTDEKPSRIARARQEIEDIVNINKDVKIGIVAFAADAHMISPITDDMETIKNLLPSLAPDVVYIQGSKLSPALDMAQHLLDFEAGNNKSVLVISDGGYEDGSAINMASSLAKKGIIINTMGVGSHEGAPIPDGKGNFIKEGSKTLMSNLETDRLQAISNAGGGIYVKAEYLDNDTKDILKKISAKANAQEKTKNKTRYWEERFYLLILPMMLLLLTWFRKGYTFPIIIFLLLAQNSQAFELSDLFKNKDQLGQQDIENKNYDSAIKEFKDPYRRGVAEYKAGKFADAEKSFQQSSRLEIQENAQYNLGNSLVQQQKLDEAAKTYENLLKSHPDNKNAQHNLDIVKKMLEQQKQNKDQDNKDNKDQKDKSSDKQDKDSQSKDKNDKESKESQQQGKDGKPQNPDDKQQGENAKPDDKDANKRNQPTSEKDGKNAENKDENKDNKQAAPEKQGDKNDKQEEDAQQSQPQNPDSQSTSNRKPAKTQQDIDADQWLNQVVNDPKTFLKNQFYLESKRNGTKEESNPW